MFIYWKTLSSAPSPLIAKIFIQYDVIDYLLKPISFERFLQAANKALRLLVPRKGLAKEEPKFIFVKTDKQLVKLNIEEILYIEGMQNYIIFHTSKEKVMALVPLKNIFELLSDKDFIKIHKSFVVAKNKVASIVGNQVSIEGKLLPISTRMKKEVLAKLTGNRLLKK